MEVCSREWKLIVARLFGADPDAIVVTPTSVCVGDRQYAIERGVVVLDAHEVSTTSVAGSREHIRQTFSEEWKAYSEIMPEHEDEFQRYFDIVNVPALEDSVVADLGCGAGRWSAKLAEKVGVIVLVDFSDAIFVARENLRRADNALFFRGDLTRLPFVQGAFDFLFSLGVLHHLDRPCLPEVKRLMGFADEGLFYLYYSLDNRPAYYRPLLRCVTVMRAMLTNVKSEKHRLLIARLLALLVYQPMVALGHAANRLRLPLSVPLHEEYKGKSTRRIQQDAYDRFFTSIEQRVSRSEISQALDRDFDVTFSESQPFWHFLVSKR